MPLSIATPNTAMKPMAEGTDRYCPVIEQAETTPPMTAKGTLAMMSPAWVQGIESGVEQHER
jgi:hypothetical protein